MARTSLNQYYLYIFEGIAFTMTMSTNKDKYISILIKNNYIKTY